MQLYISERLAEFSHVGAVILSSEPDYLGSEGSKAGKTLIYYRKPWAFPKDFLAGQFLAGSMFTPPSTIPP